MRVAVNGAAGAMGKRIVALLAQTDDCELVAALERSDHPDLGEDAGTQAGTAPLGVQLSSALSGDPDVLVDFSSPGATLGRAKKCADLGIAVVIGTTGLSAEQLAEVETQVASRVPVLVASNMSLGVNLMFALTEQVARALPEGYDVEIVEAHHRRKKDAPSGTAMELARRTAAAVARDPEEVVSHGRRGAVGPRKPEEIGVHAIRGGDIVGEHTVIFAAEGERIELTHRASSRDIFAWGAIRAARFLAGQGAGMFSMEDVLA
jgi:4-hydroxy-tetrahydrodipicolinate reductase